MCEVCCKECKGKRGLSLHQKKCITVHPSIISSASSPNMSTSGHPETESHDLQSTSEAQISDEICGVINNAYEEIVMWKKNLFDLPKGHTG